MRLKQLKLAGFKSFANPTVFNFHQTITAIVGPNGCGKSNVIDAIRWVLGETSAKQLRGDAMSDVIFAGTKDKPAKSLASVELVFENTQGKLNSAFNIYHELAIRRQVSRDGKSDYFINGTRCRRRDVVDVFLGTGLGARSYAVIEQGMISRIVDANPVQLREFIEEAAGVSRYQARRSETQHKLTQTQDNLNRLTDMQGELEKQQQKLKRQASVAKRYQNLLEEKQNLTAGLLTDDFLRAQKNLSDCTVQLQQADKAMQAAKANQVNKEDVTEQQHQTQQRLAFERDEIQQNYQQAWQQHSEAKNALTNLINQINNNHNQLQQTQLQQTQLQQAITTDKSQLTNLQTELDALTPQLEDIHQQLDTLSQQTETNHQLETINKSLYHHEQQQQQLKQQLALANQASQQLQKQTDQLHQEQTQLQEKHTQLQNKPHTHNSEALTQKLTQLDGDIQTITQDIQHLKQQKEQAQQQLNQLNFKLQQDNNQHIRLTGEYKTLATIQQKANQQIVANKSNTLLKKLQLTKAGEQYAGLIERLLNHWLNAYVIEHNHHPNWFDFIQNIAAQYSQKTPLATHQQSNHYVWQTTTDSTRTTVYPTLADWVATPTLTWFEHIVIVDNIQQADLALLQQGDSLLTTHGLFMGNGWLIDLNKQQQQLAPLSQQVRLDELQHELDALNTTLGQQKHHVEQAKNTLNDTQQQLKKAHEQKDTWVKQREQTNLTLVKQQSDEKLRNEQLTQYHNHLKNLAQQQQANKQQLSKLTEDITSHNQALETLQPQINQNKQQQQHLQEQAKQQAHATRQLQSQEQQLHLQQTKLSTQLVSKQQHLQQSEHELTKLSQHFTQLNTTLANLTAKQPEQEQQVNQLAQQSEQQHASLQQQNAALKQAEQDWQQAQTTLRQANDAYQKSQQQHHQQQTQLELGKQRLSDCKQRLQEAKISLPNHADTGMALFADNKRQQLQHTLNEISQKITGLGAVNLAAAEELNAVEDRLNTLNDHMTDISQSADTLMQAMLQIDKETKLLFMNMLTAVNSKLDTLFKQVFTGGQAQLQLIEDNWQSGLTLMAQPPGKKNSRLALLSGGEKTLTALALVFAIFKQNPAPFCVLDEVDAPLDDANVTRFSDLILQMATDVQFVFISHNKLSMQIANELKGVTMPQAGISQLVSVSLDEANAYLQHPH